MWLLITPFPGDGGRLSCRRRAESRWSLGETLFSGQDDRKKAAPGGPKARPAKQQPEVALDAACPPAEIIEPSRERGEGQGCGRDHIIQVVAPKSEPVLHSLRSTCKSKTSKIASTAVTGAMVTEMLSKRARSRCQAYVPILTCVYHINALRVLPSNNTHHETEDLQNA
jgi:hypothetical protein